ncbi:hypothetical protein Fmac_023048 [Flemingia macrophylla]|uniref:Protein CHAPERONE-LIKE PROTEIN OF POR1, chloroplastic n=1 Tax=Flemingia macrophylla TaxID=520843 RepID=A0ABD1LM11_9FABA
MAVTLSLRPDRLSPGSTFPGPPVRPPMRRPSLAEPWRAPPLLLRIQCRRRALPPVQAGSRADDSAPFEMSLENALKLLGVSEGASFDDILRAKNAILANCKDDQDAIKQVEAAYDMLLMQSLTQRRAGKVSSSSVRYADVKRAKSPAIGSMPQQWLKNSPVSIESPSTSDFGLQAGVYGALMGLTYLNGASAPAASYAGADVPGLLLAGSFGASLYFMTKKNVKLGKATVISIGGLVAGAVVGSAVENWLQKHCIDCKDKKYRIALTSHVILLRKQCRIFVRSKNQARNGFGFIDAGLNFVHQVTGV